MKLVIAFCLAALAAGALAPTAGARTTPPSMPATPDSLAKPARVDSMVPLAARTDSVWLRRLQGNDLPAHRVPHNLLPQLRTMLLRAERINNRIDRIPPVCAECPDQLPILVTFGSPTPGKPPLEACVWFKESQVRYLSHGIWMGWTWTQADTDKLLALFKKVMIKDQVVQAYVRPTPQAHAAVSPGAAPPDSAHRAPAPSDSARTN